MAPASAVSAKFGSCSASSPGGPTPMSPASTGSVGARIAPSISAAPEREPDHLGREQRDARDRQRHRDREQPHDRAPFAPAQAAVELQPGGEQREDQRDLGDVLEHLGVLDRLEPLDVEELDGGSRRRPEAEVDQRGRERALVLVGHRRHGREDGEADEQQADREGVGEREAGVRRERRSLVGRRNLRPVGVGGSGSSARPARGRRGCPARPAPAPARPAGPARPGPRAWSGSRRLVRGPPATGRGGHDDAPLSWRWAVSSTSTRRLWRPSYSRTRRAVASSVSVSRCATSRAVSSS